jgi:hypothetical protein
MPNRVQPTVSAQSDFVAHVEQFMKKTVLRINADPGTRITLRLVAYQLYGMEVPCTTFKSFRRSETRTGTYGIRENRFSFLGNELVMQNSILLVISHII